MSLVDVLENTVLIMAAAFIAGIVTGGPPFGAEVATASMMVMMTFSMLGLRFRDLEPGRLVRPVLSALLFTFVLGAAVTLLLGWPFEEEVWQGWVLVAAVPSAISVVPFSLLLGGRTEDSLVSTAMVYLVSLAITPLMTFLLIGQAVDVWELARYTMLLMLLPLIVSRPLCRLDIGPRSRVAIINSAFFFLILSVMGSNRSSFLGSPEIMAAILLVTVVRTVGLGLVLEKGLSRFGMVEAERIDAVLFTTFKNNGIAATLAIALFGEAATLPAMVSLAVEMVWFMLLKRRVYPRGTAPA